MDKKSLDKVCSQVYRRFPPFKDKKPKVTQQSEDRYLLIFSGVGEGPDGKEIQQTVRVVASSEGRILKTSMSR